MNTFITALKVVGLFKKNWVWSKDFGCFTKLGEALSRRTEILSSLELFLSRSRVRYQERALCYQALPPVTKVRAIYNKNFLHLIKSSALFTKTPTSPPSRFNDIRNKNVHFYNRIEVRGLFKKNWVQSKNFGCFTKLGDTLSRRIEILLSLERVLSRSGCRYQGRSVRYQDWTSVSKSSAAYNKNSLYLSKNSVLFTKTPASPPSQFNEIRNKNVHFYNRIEVRGLFKKNWVRSKNFGNFTKLGDTLSRRMEHLSSLELFLSRSRVRYQGQSFCYQD